MILQLHTLPLPVITNRRSAPKSGLLYTTMDLKRGTEYRRLDYPVLTAPSTAKSGFPNRLTYPTNEQTLNNASYTEAAGKIGSDKVETKLFWDKF